MAGLDFAFYQRRSYYHSPRDTISNLNGPGSLWTFMDTSLSIGTALTQIDPSEPKAAQQSLHFDGKPPFLKIQRKWPFPDCELVFASFLVLFTLEHFYVANLILLGLGAIFYILRYKYVSGPSMPQSFSETIYFPIVCTFVIIMLALLCAAYLIINPYVSYLLTKAYFVANCTNR